LGGDLLFLANMLGIKAANSNHPCPWCKVNIKKKLNLDKDMKFEKRTFNDAVTTVLNLNKKKDKKIKGKSRKKKYSK
jgi:hypothetical protein